MACERASSPQSSPQSPAAARTAATAQNRGRERVPEVFDHVILVSVDGLRSDCLEPPLLAQFPNFARLLEGPHTLEARTDPDYTVTLPNHLSMLTSRPVLGPGGHGWIGNTDPPAVRQGGTLHAQKRSYVASVFDVAHDHGVSTAIAVTKSKFALLMQSYGDETGAPDTVGADDGRQKIDRAIYARGAAQLAPMVADELRRARRPSFTFVHFGDPDFAGHATGWVMDPGSDYLAAVKTVDTALGVLLEAIESKPELMGRTAIVLTADHGGGVPERTHVDKTNPVNFRIPLVVWLDCGQETDLRDLNPHRAWPDRETQLDLAAQPQPVRNGDAGNLCLRLLGLPPIPESTYGFKDGLRVRPGDAGPVTPAPPPSAPALQPAANGDR